MTDKARTWRIRSQDRAKGRYFYLEAGRASERVSIALKYCSEAEANAALAVVQREENETHGTRHEGRIVQLARTDPEAAASYLLGDPEALGVFGHVEEAPGNLPLSEYVDRYYAPHREATRPKTWRTERFDWTRIRAGIGHVRLKKIDEYVVDGFLESLTKVDGQPATWNMRRKLRNAIRACLEHARRKKHLTGVPPAFFRLEGSSVRSLGEPEPYTPEEVHALLDAASQPRYRALFAATIVLGLRPSEAVRLDWRDVDWERQGPRGPDGAPVFVGVVHVRQGKTAQSAAAVPLIGLARTELEAWWRVCGCPAEGVMFPKNDAGDPYVLGNQRTTFRKALQAAAKRAGITRRVFPYLARHTAGTRMVEAGVPIATVAKVLRHTNPRMLEKHYDHTGATNAPGLHLAPTYEKP